MGRTKLDIEIAKQTGKSAGTIERHRREGMWPADRTAGLVRHYEVMDALGLGSGRDNWLVALLAAAHHDWPVIQLRTNLVAGCPVIPPGAEIDPGLAQSSPTFGLVRQFLTSIAMGSEAVRNEPKADRLDRETNRIVLRESPKDIAGAMADDAMAGTTKALTSQPNAAEDFTALAELVDTVADEAPNAATDDASGPLSSEPLAIDVHAEIGQLARRLTSWSDWLKEASPQELVQAVKMADRVVGLLEATAPDEAWTETERWQFVSMLTPMCGAERKDVEPIAAAMFASIKVANQSPTPPTLGELTP